MFENNSNLVLCDFFFCSDIFCSCIESFVFVNITCGDSTVQECGTNEECFSAEIEPKSSFENLCRGKDYSVCLQLSLFYCCSEKTCPCQKRDR